MNTALADITKGYISSLPFVDKIAGLVRPITSSEKIEDGKPAIRKTFPVACNVTHDECMNGKIMDLVPDSRYKSVLYFEDLGANITGSDARTFDFESRLKLVCWLNLQKLGKTSCSVSALAIGAILKALPNNNFNSGDFTRISIAMVGQDPKSNAIFSKYTYDEQVMQYLMYPFDYFAITLKLNYRLPYACIDSWTNGSEINCVDNANN
jgi:hypothetical protein